MLQLCIFDLDGTLADTLDSLVYSVSAVLKEMGYEPIDPAQCRSFVGNGARVLVEKALKAAGDTEGKRVEEGLERYRRIFVKGCTYNVVPYDGMRELLKELKARGVHLAVLTNKPHERAIDVVETVFGKGTFEVIQGQQDGMPRKPDPAPALDIAKSFGLTPGDCLYIGDSEVDIATGKAAGMKTLGVSWGFRTRGQLVEAGAEYIVDSPLQVLEEI